MVDAWGFQAIPYSLLHQVEVKDFEFDMQETPEVDFSNIEDGEGQSAA
jgi:hypothetical protein